MRSNGKSYLIRALLLNEALLMQASVSNIKDKETAPVAEHKWDSVLHFSATWNY